MQKYIFHCKGQLLMEAMQDHSVQLIQTALLEY